MWVFDNPNVNVYLSFTIKITASHLRKIRYTPYQYELWNICNSMREEGATFPAIAKYLNENGYKSALQSIQSQWNKSESLLFLAKNINNILRFLLK